MKALRFTLILIGTVVMVFVMARTGAPLKTLTTPNGIIDLEFARTAKSAAAIFNSWSADRLTGQAKFNTWLDYIFLFFYSALLFYSCRWLSRSIRGKMGSAGFSVARAGLLAGALDLFENAGMLLMLDGKINAAIAFSTTVISMIKWVLVIVCLLYLLAGGLSMVWSRMRQ